MLVFAVAAMNGYSQATFAFSTATFNSGTSGWDQAGVGSYYKTTSGGTTSTGTGTGTTCGGSTLFYTSGSNTFYFLTTNAITDLTINGTSSASSVRTFSQLSTASSLNGTYSNVGSTTNTSTLGLTCGNITITPATTIPANTYMKFVFSGNVNVNSIVCTLQGTPYYYGASLTSDITNANAWWATADGTGQGVSGAHPAAVTASGMSLYIQNTTTAPTMGSALTLGSGTKIFVGGGSGAAAFTIGGANALTGTVDVASNGTLNIANTTIPTIGTLASGSTVAYTGSSAQTVTAGTYDKLTISNAAGATLGGIITANGALTISSGATLDVSGSSFGITAKGNWVNNGTFTPQSGTVTFGGTTTISGTSVTQFKNIAISASSTLTGPSSGTMNVSGSFANSGTFTHNSSTVVFNGTTTVTGTTAFSGVTINGSSSLTMPTGSIAGSLTNNGTTTFSGTTTFNGTTNQTVSGSSSNTFSNLTINNTGTSPNNIVDFTSVLSVSSGNTTLTAGILKISSASSFTPFSGTNTIPSAAGLILNNASAVMAWGSAGSLTLNGTLTITSAGGTMTVGTGNNSLVMGSTPAALTLSGGTLNIRGRFTATSSGTTTINGGSLIIPTGGTINAAGNSIVQIGNSHVFSMSSGAITVRSKNTNTTLPDLSIIQSANNITGGTITVSDATITVNSNIPVYDFVVDNGSGTAIASLSAALTVSRNLTVTSGTLLANNNNISVGGNWNNAGTYTAGTNTVNFNGSNAQQFTQSGSGSFSSLTLTNANGLTLNNALVVSGTLTLSNGKLSIGNNNLTLSTAVSGPSAFGNATSNYIVAGGSGKLLIQNIGTALTGDVLFPVGASSSSYTPLVVNTGNTGNANTFGVSVTASAIGGSVSANSVQVSWPMSHTIGTDAAIIKAQWNATAPQTGDEGTSFTRASSQVVNYNGSLNPVGTIAAAVNSATNIYTHTSGISFSSVSTIGVTNGVAISTFYNVSGADITNVVNWGSNTDGTGSNPADFVSDNQIFTISNSGATMSGPWTVSGTGATITVGDGTNNVTFAQTDVVNGTIHVSNHGTLQIVTATIPTFGTLATGSTIDYAGSAQAITAANYSHLTLSGTGTTFPAGTVGIAGTFTPGSISTATQGTIEFNGGGGQTIPAFNYFNLTSSGSGARTLASSGTVGIASTFTPGGNSYTITGSTIDYNGSGTQSILAMNYHSLALGGSGTRTFPSGTVGIAGTFTPGIFTSAAQGTVNFNGSGSAQTIPAFAFTNITCSNSAGTSIANGTTASFAGTATTALNISAGTLTVNGTLENKAVAATTAGNVTSTTASLVVSSSGTVKLSTVPASSSGVAFIPTATWQSGSTVLLALGATGSSSDYTGLQGVKQTFSNFTISSPAFDTKLLLTTNTNASTAPFMIIGGALTITSTGTGTGVQLINTNKNNNQLAIGSYLQTGGNVYVVNSASSAATRTVAVSGDVTVNGGLLSLNTTSNNTSGNNGTLTIGGNLTIGSGGTLAKEAAGTNATGFLQFTAATGDQTFTNSGTFSGAADITVSKATSGNLVLGSNLTTTGTLTLTAGNLQVGSNTLTIKSTVSHAGAYNIDAQSGSIVLNGSAQSIPTGMFNNNTIKNLTVNNTTSATFTDATTVSDALTLTNGTLTMSGGISIGTGALITRSAGTLATVPSFGASVDVTYTNGSTLSSGNELPTSSSVLRDLTLSNGSVNLLSNATVNGTATLSSGTLGISSNTINFEGAVSVTSGTISSASSGTVNFNGSAAQTVPAVNYGNLGFNGSAKTLTAGTTGISGTFTNNAGSGHTVTGTTINFNGAGAQTIPTFNYENLQTSTSGTKTIGGSMNIGGDVTIGNGTFLASDNNNLAVAGNWTENGTFTPGTGTVSFHNSGNQSITAAAGAHFYDLSISKSGGSFTLSATTNVANRLQLEEGTVTNSNNLVMATGARIIRTLGSVDGAPTFAGPVDLEYANNGNMTAGDEVPATDIVRDVTINGGGSVTLGRSIRVNGTLALSNGIVDLSSFNLSAEAGSITGGSSSSYARTSGAGAFIIRNVPNTATDFPVGNSTYNPLQIANPVALDWSVRVEDGLSNVVGVYAPNVNKAVSRQWDITPSAGSPAPGGGATVTFLYNGSTDVGASFNNAVDVQVWHYDAVGGWAKRGGAYTPDNVGGMKAVTVSGLTYFSPFGISNIDAPLPVSLLSFTGKRNGSVNELKWKTASESNNRGFAIERSADGVVFTQVSFLNSRATGGNSSSDISYNYSETLTAGTKWYYRLKQVDFDGQYKYSAVVLLKGDKSGAITVEGIYPNPVKASASIRLQASGKGGSVVLQLTDMLGKVVRTQSVNTEAGAATTVSMDMSGLAAGQYHLKAIAGEEVSETVTVIKN